MPESSYEAGRRERPATVNAVLQIITLFVLGTGGAVAKSGYDDLADRLTEARIEAAELRKVVEAQSDLRISADIEVNALRSRVETIDLRLTALEVHSESDKKRRK